MFEGLAGELPDSVVVGCEVRVQFRSLEVEPHGEEYDRTNKADQHDDGSVQVPIGHKVAGWLTLLCFTSPEPEEAAETRVTMLGIL